MDLELELENELNSDSKNIITISVQKRNERKCITIISGIDGKLNLKKMLKYFKKTYNCNGTLIKDEEFGNIITLTGNNVDNVSNFLVKENICKSDEIIIKGV